MWILGLKGLTAVRCKTIILSLAHEAKSRSWWWCADFFSKDTVRLSVNLTALIPAAPPELCWDEGGDCVDEPESERESWDNIGGLLSISSCDDKNNNNPWFYQITLTYLNGTIMWLEPAASHIHEASKSKRSKQIMLVEEINEKFTSTKLSNLYRCFSQGHREKSLILQILQFARPSWKLVNFVNFEVLQGHHKKLTIL